MAQEAIGSDSLKMWEKVLLENRLVWLASRVEVPCLWLHASDDELVRIRQVRAVVKRMSQSKLMIVPGRSGMDIWRHRAAMQAMTRFMGKGFGTEHEFRLRNVEGTRKWPLTRPVSRSARWTSPGCRRRTHQPRDFRRLVYQPEYRFLSPTQYF